MKLKNIALNNLRLIKPFFQLIVHYFLSVGCFPAEICSLLRWKSSTTTPKVVRDCVKRTGFKITKSMFY